MKIIELDFEKLGIGPKEKPVDKRVFGSYSDASGNMKSGVVPGNLVFQQGIKDRTGQSIRRDQRVEPKKKVSKSFLDTDIPSSTAKTTPDLGERTKLLMQLAPFIPELKGIAQKESVRVGGLLSETEEELKREQEKLAILKEGAKGERKIQRGLILAPPTKEGTNIEPISTQVSRQNVLIGEQKTAIKNYKLAQDSYDSFIKNVGKKPEIAQDFIDGLSDSFAEPGKKIPFLGTVLSFNELGETYDAAEKLSQGSQLTTKEESLIEKARSNNLPIDRSIWYGAGRIVAEMPTYVAEFAAIKTLVAKPVGSALAKRVSSKIISIPQFAQTMWKIPAEVSSEVAVSKIIQIGTQGVVGGLYKTPEGTLERMLPNFNELNSEISKELYGDIGGETTWTQAMTRAFGVNAVESMTEYAGALVDKPVSALAKMTFGKWLSKMGIEVTASNFNKIAKTVGWDGIIGEVFEEELGELLQAPIDNRKYSAPWTPEGFERFLTEVIGISAAGGFGKISTRTFSKISNLQKQKDSEAGKITIGRELNGFSEEAKKFDTVEKFINKVRSDGFSIGEENTVELNPQELLSKEDNEAIQEDKLGRLVTRPSFKFLLENDQPKPILVKEYVSDSGETRRVIIDGNNRTKAQAVKGEKVKANIIKVEGRNGLDKRLTEIYNQAKVVAPKVTVKGATITPKKIAPKTQIRKDTGQVKTSERMIAENKVLQAVLRGEAKAARVAFSEGKKKGIFTTKENFAGVIARAKERREFIKEVSTIKKTIRKANLKKLRPERRANIEEIVKALDFVGMTEGKSKQLNSRLHHIGENPLNQIPQNKLNELERLNKKKVSDLTIEELRLISTAIGHEVALNRLKNKFIFGKRLREASEVVEAARTNINSKIVADKTDPDIILSSEVEKKNSKLKDALTVKSYNTELISEILDRKKKGIIKKVIYEGIDKGVSTQLEMEQKVMDQLRNELSGIDIARWSKAFQKKAKDIDFIRVELTNGKTIEITKDEKVSIMLLSKRAKGLEHLLGGGFRFASNRAKRHELSLEDIDNIVSSATKEEKEVAAIADRFFNETIKEEVNDVSVDLNGFEIAREENYFPIDTIALDRKRDPGKASRNFGQFTLEGQGIFKQTTDAKNAVLLEGVFISMFKHLKKTSSYVGLAKPLRNAKMLLQNRDFAQDVIDVYGEQYLKTLENYIKDIEQQTFSTDLVDKILVRMSNRLTVALLGANPFVMLKQPISYIGASTEINPKYLSDAVTTKTDFNQIKKWSPQLRDRLEGNVTKELGELGQVGMVRKFFLDKAAPSQIFMSGIKKFDFETIGRIWNAVIMETNELHPELDGDSAWKHVAERTEEIVRLTQPTFAVKDRSEIGRSPSTLIRFSTRFTSQRNKNLNMIRRAILRYDIGAKTAKDKGLLTAKLFVVSVLSPLLVGGVDELRRAVYGKKRSTWFQFLVKGFGSALSNIYFLGDLWSSFSSKVNANGYGGWNMSNPVSSFIDNAIDAVVDGTLAIKQMVSGEKYKSGDKRGEAKWKTSITKFAEEAVSTASGFAGIPTDSVKKILQGVWKFGVSKFEPTNVLDIQGIDIPEIDIPEIDIDIPEIDIPGINF